MRAWMVVVLITGCGDNLAVAPDARVVPTPDAPPSPADRYEPWTVGSTWVYRLSDPRGLVPITMGTTTVEEEVVLAGGQSAFRVHVEKMPTGYSPSNAVVWSKDVYEAYVGDLDVRYRSEFFDHDGALVMVATETPFRLKLNESPGTNGQKTESFVETLSGIFRPTLTRARLESWTVVSPNEDITVPAGTFACLHVQRVNAAHSNRVVTQDYWYARGVGKVKETGGPQIEELVSFDLKR